MSSIPASQALGYALSREIVGVYLVVLLGLVLLFIGNAGLFAIAPFFVGSLLRVVFTVTGFVAFYVGLVALLYKIIVDATAAAS